MGLGREDRIGAPELVATTRPEIDRLFMRTFVVDAAPLLGPASLTNRVFPNRSLAPTRKNHEGRRREATDLRSIGGDTTPSVASFGS